MLVEIFLLVKITFVLVSALTAFACVFGAIVGIVAIAFDPADKVGR